MDFSLTDSRKVQWLQYLLCVGVKSVEKTTKSNGLVPDNYADAAVSNVRGLKRLPKDSHLLLATSDEIFAPFRIKINKTCWLSNLSEPFILVYRYTGFSKDFFVLESP